MAAEDHFLIIRRSSLIDQITSVDPVLDKLLERKRITSEQYGLIRQGMTPQEKMRLLLDRVRSWGRTNKDEVLSMLKEENPCVAIFTEERLLDQTPDVCIEKLGRQMSVVSPTPSQEENFFADRRSQQERRQFSGASSASSKMQSIRAVHNYNDILLIGTPAAFQTQAKQKKAADTVGRYGNILDVECTGASEFTALRNGLKEAGRQASYIIAEEDMAKLLQYKDVILKVARTKNLDPALIAGIISRETRFGDLLKNGWGHDRECFGLMQVSKLHHKIVGEWNSEEHISQGAGILVDMIQAIQRKFPEWRPECQLKGGIAAYNRGPTMIWDYEEIDKETVAGDYSNDVAARAQWFAKYF